MPGIAKRHKKHTNSRATKRPQAKAEAVDLAAVLPVYAKPTQRLSTFSADLVNCDCPTKRTAWGFSWIFFSRETLLVLETSPQPL